MTEFYCQWHRSWVMPLLCIRRQLAKGKDYARGRYPMCKKCKQGLDILDQNPDALKVAKVPIVRRPKAPKPPRHIEQTHYHRTPDFGADGDKPYNQLKQERAERTRNDTCR